MKSKKDKLSPKKGSRRRPTAVRRTAEVVASADATTLTGENQSATDAKTLSSVGDGHRPPLQRQEGDAPLDTSTHPLIGDFAMTPLSEEQSKKTLAMLLRWKRIRAGEIPHPDKVRRNAPPSRNPLLDLPESRRALLYVWLRECPYPHIVIELMREEGLPGLTSDQVEDFFAQEAYNQAEFRIGRAAIEANALIRVVEACPVKFSDAILAALGQEAFRQINSEQIEPAAVAKFSELFFKARSDDRVDQMQELKREKMRQELQGQTAQALEKLSEEVQAHPEARAAFEALSRELSGEKEGAES